jgi:hypothetical protein
MTSKTPIQLHHVFTHPRRDREKLRDGVVTGIESDTLLGLTGNRRP